MTSTADLLTAINPLPDDAAARLAIDAAEREMLEALLAGADLPAPAVPPGRAPARRRRVLAVIGTAAVAIPVLAVLAALPLGRNHGARPAPPTPPAGRTATTHQTATTRSTANAPLILFEQPGWHAWYGDEQSPLMGELDFARVGARISNGAPAGGDAELHWYPANEAAGYIKDRADSASITTKLTVLGALAHVIQYTGRVAGHQHMYSAIWTRGPRMLEFRANAPDMAGFEAQLAKLRIVNGSTWLKALPKTVVPSTRRSAVIRTMLRGIPLPPGFSVSQIPGRTLNSDRYQLGAAVTGVVACEWFARWGRAKATGNQAVVNQAVSAMATAKHWSVLKQMSRTGAWPSVLIGYAKDMPGGLSYGRPLLGDLDSGLGCSGSWHIKLPGVTPNDAVKPVKSAT